MIRIFTIPFDVNQGTFDESSLNQFLLNKKLNNMVIRFFTLGDNAYWTAFLDVDPILKDVKSRGNRQMENELSDNQKQLYRKLREWRKEKADGAGIPVYVVATNSLLLEVAKQAPDTMEKLKSIKGFGTKKIEKYGQELIGLLRAFFETS